MAVAGLAAAQGAQTAKEWGSKNLGPEVIDPNPFKGSLMNFLDFRMTAAPLFILALINIFGVIATIVIVILELVTLITSGFNLNNPPYTDAQSYSLFALNVPSVVVCGFELAMVIAGRLIFSNFAGQLAHFLFIILFGAVAGAFTLIATIVSGSRMTDCINNGANVFCQDEKSALAWVFSLSLILGLVLITDGFFAVILLFIRPLQYMAMGMDANWRKAMTAAKDKVERKKLIDAFMYGMDMRGKKYSPETIAMISKEGGAPKIPGRFNVGSSYDVSSLLNRKN
jgi:hypothetical protein